MVPSRWRALGTPKYLISTVSLRGGLIPRLGRAQVEAFPTIAYFLLFFNVSICFPAVESTHRTGEPLLQGVGGALGTRGTVDGVQGRLSLQVGHGFRFASIFAGGMRVCI